MSNTKPTKRDMDSEQKKKRIYEAAIALFREHGYEKTTMTDICEAVQMSRGSVYHFFSRKSDLLLHFFEDTKAAAVNSARISEENLDNPAQTISGLLIALALGYESIGYDLTVCMQNISGDGSVGRDSGIISGMARYIKAAQNRGSFAVSIDCVEVAHLIHTASVGCLRKWIMDGGKYPLADAYRWFMPYILNIFVPTESRLPFAECPDAMRYAVAEGNVLVTSAML